MSNYILGTAGHVDHGKTALVKALTGVDTDSLEEEKERGMTLDLGFARLDLPSGNICSIVDVPGHERYLKNMLVGVGGLDFVLLVIDAGEGIMPQTREHLEILQLLNIQSGLAVITKIDLVSSKEIDELTKQLENFFKGTLFENSLIIKVSSQTGEGLDDLIAQIDKNLEKITPKDTSLPFRMPIDKVFSVPGFGTVVTGTVYQGAIKKDQTVEILPFSKRTKVRNIESFGKRVDEAKAGERVALNLGRTNIESLGRGNQIFTPGVIRPTKNLDVSLKVLSSCPHPLKNRAEIRLYVGTTEVFGKVILLDADILNPGESGYAQLILKNMIGSLSGDNFIVRAPSAIFTIGGGTILDPHPTYHRRFDKKAIEMLKLKENGDPTSIIENVMHREPFNIFTQDTLSVSTSLPLSEVCEVLKNLKKEEELYATVSGKVVLKKTIDYLSDYTIDILKKLQEINPSDLGRPYEEIKRNMPRMENRLFREIIMYLKSQDKIKEKKGLLATKEFTPKMEETKDKCYKWIKKQINESGYTPPSKQELLINKEFSKKTIEQVISHMSYNEEIIFVNENILISPDKLDEAKKLIGNFIIKNQSISPSEARVLLKSTRKYIIPMLEYFDSIYFTKRKDNKRVLFRQNVIAN